MPAAHTPRLWGWYLAIGLALGLVFILLGLRSTHFAPSHRWSRRAFGTLAILWTFVLGSAGLFLAWAELFTGHVAAYHNENLLHFNPVAIFLVVLIPAMILKKTWAILPGGIILILTVASGVIGLLLKAFPFFYQSNWGMIALTLPPNLGLLWELCPPIRSFVSKIFVRKRTQLPVN